MSEPQERKVVVSKNGPYLVYGSVPMRIEVIGVDASGGSWEWEHGRSFELQEHVELCRCGHSSNKPYCDDSHIKVKFDGTETATRATHAEQSQVFDGPALRLDDAEALCAFARFCDNRGTVWARVEDSGNAASREIAEHEATRCPGGRLVVSDKHTHHQIEPHLEPSIGVIEDPSQKCSGGLWVRGRIRVESADGTPYEVRNRVALCRCGESSNKPFCDGSHASTGFNDGLTP